MSLNMGRNLKKFYDRRKRYIITILKKLDLAGRTSISSGRNDSVVAVAVT